MTQPPTFQLRPKISSKLQQMQRLIMAPKIQQSLAYLQMARQEMEAAMRQEVEENPLLELQEASEDSDTFAEDFDEEEQADENSDHKEKELDFTEQDFLVLGQLGEDFNDHFSQNDTTYEPKNEEQEELKNFIESSIRAPIALSEFLMAQVRESLPDSEWKTAEIVIGYLDENGFLTTPLEEICTWNSLELEDLQKVVDIIQTFEPYGVGARNLQECLLIQLKEQSKEFSLSYKIIKNHFNDLIHNRIPKIVQSLHSSAKAVRESIEKDIGKLTLHPTDFFNKSNSSIIIPDITIKQEEKSGELQVYIHDECCFSLRLNSKYLRLLNNPELPSDTEEYIKKNIHSAKWLLRNLHQRSLTLEKIARFLIQAHYSFFTSPDGTLTPLTMQQIADELGLHESTIARAVANKYINTPRGIFSLRFFFSNSYATQGGEEISSRTVKNTLETIISSEDKKKPFTDDQLSQILEKKGIKCARRTVAKYRRELEQGSAHQRKIY